MKSNMYNAKTISMRLVDINDAVFICDLRNNESYNKHLSLTSSSVADQENWLRNYKSRECKGEEYYYIISRGKDNKKIGTVRLYDFKKDINSFCWGSWILNDDKTPSAALESALLVYKIAFCFLGFERSHFDVRKNNEKVIAFHKKMGAEQISESNDDLFFIYTKETYIKTKEKFKKYQE
ncbi:GNAT family N-acetyltransferase [Erwinia sp. D4-22]